MTTYTDHDYTHSDAEFAEMWHLLAETNGRIGRPFNWTFARLENWRFASWDRTPEEFRRMVHLWRDGDGRLAGFTITEHGDDDLDLQVRPDCRDVEGPMLDWLERRYRGERPALPVTCFADDDPRAEVLRARGFREDRAIGNFRSYNLDQPRPSISIPPGYRLSDLGEYSDYATYARLEGVAFENDYVDENWYRGKARSPHYDPRLHVIVLSPGGEPVSVAHGWLETQFCTAEIDPVATHPDHRRLHLAEAAIVEAFNRLASCGGRVAWIVSGAEPNPSNRLYERLSPVSLATMIRWSKPL
ncbi:MAG: GNAT family N-acetyltransferase [Chloroflexota bacterium]